MKKKMLLAAGCLMALAAHADGAYSYLTFTHNNLAEQSFSAADLTIAFENGQAVVAQNGNKTTLALADEMNRYFARGYTPKVKPGKHCSACSLKALCLPVLCRRADLNAYLRAHLDEPLGGA